MFTSAAAVLQVAMTRLPKKQAEAGVVFLFFFSFSMAKSFNQLEDQKPPLQKDIGTLSVLALAIATPKYTVAEVTYVCHFASPFLRKKTK